MNSPADNRITLVEVFELLRPYEEFQQVIQAATCRLEAEGVKSLLGVQFYGEPDSKQAGALIMFADAGELTQHLEMIAQWEEFHQLLHVVKPVDVRVYGKLSPEAESWIRQFNALSCVWEHQVAGFVR